MIPSRITCRYLRKGQYKSQSCAQRLVQFRSPLRVPLSWSHVVHESFRSTHARCHRSSYRGAYTDFCGPYARNRHANGQSRLARKDVQPSLLSRGLIGQNLAGTSHYILCRSYDTASTPARGFFGRDRTTRAVGIHRPQPVIRRATARSRCNTRRRADYAEHLCVANRHARLDARPADRRQTDRRRPRAEEIAVWRVRLERAASSLLGRHEACVGVPQETRRTDCSWRRDVSMRIRTRSSVRSFSQRRKRTPG